MPRGMAVSIFSQAMDENPSNYSINAKLILPKINTDSMLLVNLYYV